MRFIRVFLLLSLTLLGACRSQATLPTLVPTATALPATATALPTRTPFPTAEPSATPFKTVADDPSQQAQIRIVHAGVNVAGLDVYLERLALVNGIGYGQRTTPSPVVTGTYTLSIVPSGGRLEDGAKLKVAFEAKGQATYVLVIYGTNADLKAQVIALDLSPLKKTETRVSLFNTFTDGGPVTVVNTLNEGVVLGGVAANSLSPAQVIPANGAKLQIRAGTISLSDVNAPLDPMTSTLLVLAGLSNDRATMQVIPIEGQVNGEGRIKILGTIEGVSDLDVYANDILLVSGLGDRVISDAVTLPSGIYNLTLYPHGADKATATVLTGTQIQINADEDRIVALFGTQGSINFETLVEDTTQTALGRARIVFFNPVSKATHVNISSDVLSDIIPVRYGRFSAIYDVPARTTSFTWTQSNSQGNLDTLESALDLPLKAGESYLYIFNARGLVNFNFLYSRTVGESSSIVSGAVTPTPLPPTAQPAPRLRMVNALPNQFVEFRLDDMPIARGLPYANSSPSILMQPGEKTLTAHSSDGTQLLGRITTTFNPSTSYSAYLYGDSVPYNLVVVEDQPLYDSTAPSFRVINLSTSAQQVGAAIAPYVPSTTIEVALTPSQANEGYSIPGGIERIAENIAPSAVSEFGYVVVSSPQTIYILDTEASLVNMTLDNLTFNPNMSYDIVIFKRINQPVQAFVVSYPPA